MAAWPRLQHLSPTSFSVMPVTTGIQVLKFLNLESLSLL
jgi:hypothetical protein